MLLLLLLLVLFEVLARLVWQLLQSMFVHWCKGNFTQSNSRIVNFNSIAVLLSLYTCVVAGGRPMDDQTVCFHFATLLFERRIADVNSSMKTCITWSRRRNMQTEKSEAVVEWKFNTQIAKFRHSINSTIPRNNFQKLSLYFLQALAFDLLLIKLVYFAPFNYKGQHLLSGMTKTFQNRQKNDKFAVRLLPIM